MSIEDIKNFKHVDAQLATAGQPTETQFQELASAGYEVVINLGLLDPRYCLPDEAGLVLSLGMEYHHIPVVFDSPRISEFERFVEVLNSHSGRKTFIHCALNWRVSTFIALYGELRLDWSRTKANTHMRSFWEPNAVWASFAAQCRAKALGVALPEAPGDTTGSGD